LGTSGPYLRNDLSSGLRTGLTVVELRLTIGLVTT